MPSQPKPAPKKVGRPALPEGHAKSGAIQVRLNSEDLKAVTIAAQMSNQTVSEWIRASVKDSLLKSLAVLNEQKGSRSLESRNVRRTLRSVGVKRALRNV